MRKIFSWHVSTNLLCEKFNNLVGIGQPNCERFNNVGRLAAGESVATGQGITRHHTHENGTI